MGHNLMIILAFKCGHVVAFCETIWRLNFIQLLRCCYMFKFYAPMVGHLALFNCSCHHKPSHSPSSIQSCKCSCKLSCKSRYCPRWCNFMDGCNFLASYKSDQCCLQLTYHVMSFVIGVIYDCWRQLGDF